MHRHTPSNRSLFLPLWAWAALTGWASIVLITHLMFGSPVLTGYLEDADDYLRMSRIFDLLDGKHYPSWIQPRLGPGGSVENGWSRLIDGPLYLLMVFFQQFAGRYTAALWTATVFPAMALLALTFAAIWYTCGVMKEDRPTVSSAMLALFSILCMWETLYQFSPGRVTHHDWQIVLTTGAYGCLIRLCRKPNQRRWPILAGILFATGLGIGADIVPWFALGVALVGIHFLIRGADYELAAFRLGFSVTLATAVWFVILVPPARYSVPQCDTISPTYLSFAAAVGNFWAVVCVLPHSWKNTPGRRSAASGFVAIGVLAILYELSPGCFHDIYNLHDPLVRTAWLGRVAEAQSVLAVTKGNPVQRYFMLVPLALAFAGALRAAWVEKDLRLLWTGLTIVIASGIALSFWQFRTLGFTQALAIAPLASMTAAIIDELKTLARRISKRFQSFNRMQRIGLEIVFFLISLGCIATAVRHPGRSGHAPRIVLMQERCSIKEAAPALNTIPAPQMIAAFVDEGSEIIYRTQHWALAGDYHRDEEGIGASYRIFIAPDAETAHDIVRQYKVGVLLVCPAQRSFWESIAPQKSYFAAQLLDGNIPPWLSRVQGAGAIQIYRVKN